MRSLRTALFVDCAAFVAVGALFAYLCVRDLGREHRRRLPPWLDGEVTRLADALDPESPVPRFTDTSKIPARFNSPDGERGFVIGLESGEPVLWSDSMGSKPDALEALLRSPAQHFEARMGDGRPALAASAKVKVRGRQEAPFTIVVCQDATPFAAAQSDAAWSIVGYSLLLLGLFGAMAWSHSRELSRVLASIGKRVERIGPSASEAPSGFQGLAVPRELRPLLEELERLRLRLSGERREG
jgi:hypothetical protein